MLSTPLIWASMGAATGIGHGLGIGAGIHGRHRHLDGGDGRILLHGKHRHGYQAAEADEKAHNLGKDGPVNEEFQNS